MTDVVLKPVPFHPLIILTPPSHGQPEEKTLQLIQAAVDRICADDTVYSVTYSPVLCPDDKRYLYVLHPHYWQKSDGSWGTFTRRRSPSHLLVYQADKQKDVGASVTLVSSCGLRPLFVRLNCVSRSDCEVPQGQKQLEELCKAIRDLALGVKYLPDESLKKAANERAKQLLKVFFVDAETKMLPQVEYAQVIPGQEGAKGNSLFVIPVGAPGRAEPSSGSNEHSLTSVAFPTACDSASALPGP